MNENVIFAAVRSSSGDMGSSGTITYDSLTTNIGNGMDSSTGKFTTPTSGLYMFTFSAVSANTNTADVTIVVKKNNIQLFVIDDEEGTSSGAKERNIAYSWMLNLSTGDIVHLEMSTGGLHADASNAVADQVHFTGHLLHANWRKQRNKSLVYLVDIFHLHVAPQYRDFGTIVRNSEALDRVDFIRTAF